MQTDGVFGIGSFRIHVTKINSPITIYAISDVHYNSPQCDHKKWRDFLTEAKSRKDAYFIFIGDLFDSLSSGERRAYVTANFHDSTISTLSDKFETDISDFVDEIKFMKNRVIAVIGGNHFWEFKDGTTCDQRVAMALNARYLGCNAMIRVMFKYCANVQTVDFCCHHGLGGGRTVGSSMNKLEWMAKAFDADIMLMGHDHNRAVDYINRLSLTNNRTGELRLVNKRVMLARTGSFLKAYEPGKSSYAVDAMYQPSDLGALRITITPRRKQKHDPRHADYEDLRWLETEATI